MALFMSGEAILLHGLLRGLPTPTHKVTSVRTCGPRVTHGKFNDALPAEIYDGRDTLASTRRYKLYTEYNTIHLRRIHRQIT
jgi:hypothetical protein